MVPVLRSTHPRSRLPDLWRPAKAPQVGGPFGPTIRSGSLRSFERSQVEAVGGFPTEKVAGDLELGSFRGRTMWSGLERVSGANAGTLRSKKVGTLPESEPASPGSTHSEPFERERISLWRNNDVWSDRLREDRAILQAQLSPAQAEAIRGIVESADGEGKLEFLVVYGSVSRGEQRADSDLDIYYETRELAAEIERADPDSRWHVFGVPSGALLESVRRGDEMAFGIVSDALVVFDDGLFRALLVAVDEEQLTQAEP